MILQNPKDDCVIWCGEKHVDHLIHLLSSFHFKKKEINSKMAMISSKHSVATNCILPQDML